MSGRAKRLRMIAGPNGSGKSTLIQGLGREFAENGLFWLHYYINADDLQRALRLDGVDFSKFGLQATWELLRESLLSGGRLAGEHPFLRTATVNQSRLTAPVEACDGYVAACVADFLREELLNCGESFSFETVMSHPNKVEFFARARTQGYRTYLYFISTESPVVNVSRIETRVATGGHDVPHDKILERYERTMRLARDAIAHAYRAFIFDNSGIEPVWLAEFDADGKCTLHVAESALPNWYRQWVSSSESTTGSE
jgi:predicted ABC-type ATPase